MSHTYDAELSALLERAAEAGMTDLEQQGWRSRLDPIALDECGCEASAKAAAVVGTLGGATVLAPRRGQRGRRGSTLLAAVVATIAMAVAAKLLGQRSAQRRRELLVSTLAGRIQELEAHNALSNG